MTLNAVVVGGGIGGVAAGLAVWFTVLWKRATQQS